MYLKSATSTKTGRTYLSIAQGFRDSEGKNRTKTIQSLGYVDVLEKEYDDPVAHFETVVAEMEAVRKEEMAPVSLLIDPTERLKEEALRKNLGFVALSTIYHELGLHSFFTRLGNKDKTRYNLNQIVKLLVYERILNPGSKRKAVAAKESYFEKFDFSQDDVYRSLDVLDSAVHSLQAFLHKRVSAKYERNTEVLYYDVTNYYFESDLTDTLRKKGVSKEHRPDPIVQMGLLSDSRGLPMAWDLFAGNTNDCKTLLPVIHRVKKTYDAGRIIVVADKGINSSDNCAYALLTGNGYVFSKSVRGAAEKLQKWCLDSAGYKEGPDKRLLKSRIAKRNLHIEGLNGKKKPIPVSERQVAIFSPKYARRAAAKRAEALEKAKSFIDNPASYNRQISYGAAKYVKGLTVDKKTGEILDCATCLELDIARIEAEARFDGYYLIVSSEKNRSPEEIANMYAGLYKIEDSFKVSKSFLKARPVHVQTESHIRAHFLTCFLALLIIRILEMKVEHKYSVGSIIESLKRACATHIESNWWAFDYHDKTLDAIGAACNVDFSRRYLELKTIKTIVGDTKK
jgi:hypothetical protein